MDNWKEYKIPSHHVISVKLDPETGGVTAIVDIERVVKSIRQETVKRCLEVLPKKESGAKGDLMESYENGFNEAIGEMTDNITNLNKEDGNA